MNSTRHEPDTTVRKASDGDGSQRPSKCRFDGRVSGLIFDRVVTDTNKARAVYASVEGQTHDAWTRKVHLNSENNGKLEGSTAVPNASTRAPDGMAEKPHVSLADKIKGQYKIALGGMKHDVNLAQEGEDLKNGDKDRLH